MKQTSNAAKAASIMHHTWGVPDFTTAVAIYDDLYSSHGPLVDVLDKYNVGVWDALDQLSESQWWENVECLALSIDAAYFYFNLKEQA